MSDLAHSVLDFFGLTSRPYAIGGIVLILLYVIQAEVRFGAKARSSSAGAADKGSSLVLSLAAMAPVVGFVLAIKLAPLAIASRYPLVFWLFGPTLPGLPAVGWVSFGVGMAGLALRMWAVLTLRHRYTRTLLIHDGHEIERGGPYRYVRHPGYLGSLLCLNAVAATSGATPVLVVSLLATITAYAYRVRTEDAMLVAAIGAPYEEYRREVGALLPFLR